MNAKTPSVLFCFLLVHLSISFAQAPSWLWAQGGGGFGLDWPLGMAVDANGNIYVTGYYADSAATFGGFVLPNAGSEDMFLIKYNASGNLLWARHAGGTGRERGTGIATDANGNVYVCGSFSSHSLNFGSTVLNNADTVGNTHDAFLVKFSPSGTVDWAVRAGGQNTTVANALCLDGAGNIYATGGFMDPVFVFGGDTLSNAGSYDVFLLKFSDTGNPLWAKSFGSTQASQGMALGFDQHRSIALAGYFWDAALAIGSSIISNAGTEDIFVARYDTAGNVIWARDAGGSDDDNVMDARVDANGRIYLTGEFISPILWFGSLSVSHTVNVGWYNTYVACLDSAGTFRWVNGAGGGTTYLNGGSGLCTDNSGNAYVTGYFEDSTIVFGSQTLTHYGAAGPDDLFVVKYDSMGVARWAQSASGFGSDWGFRIAYYNGSLIVASLIDDSCSFGSTTVIPNGFFDVAVAKLDQSTGLLPVSPEAAWEIYPNPSHGSIIVQIKSASTRTNVEVINPMGQVFSRRTCEGPGSYSMSLGNANGLYFVRLTDEKGVQRLFKIIKQ